MNDAMKALVIGADSLGAIPNLLDERGIKIHCHWNGRKKGMRKMDIPENVDMVIVLYDFVEHQLTEKVKRKAKKMEIPCVYSKRTISDLANQLDRCAKCKRYNECSKCNKCPKCDIMGKIKK